MRMRTRTAINLWIHQPTWRIRPYMLKSKHVCIAIPNQITICSISPSISIIGNGLFLDLSLSINVIEATDALREHRNSTALTPRYRRGHTVTSHHIQQRHKNYNAWRRPENVAANGMSWTVFESNHQMCIKSTHVRLMYRDIYFAIFIQNTHFHMVKSSVYNEVLCLFSISLFVSLAKFGSLSVRVFFCTTHACSLQPSVDRTSLFFSLNKCYNSRAIPIVPVNIRIFNVEAGIGWCAISTAVEV